MILLGYEVGTAKPITLPLHHLIITGMTRLSGKTTTLEALVARSGLKAITFRTKRGEIGFEQANRVPLYFDDGDLTEWRALEGLMEATLEEKVRREPGVRAALIRVCRNPTPVKSLREVYERIIALDENPKIKGFLQDVYTKLRAYLEIVIPQIERLEFTRELSLGRGANMMDLVEEGLSDEMQNLVLYGVLKRIYERERDTIIVIPEAWKFIPQDRGSPCKPIVERLIREGGAIGNYLWIDSQDLRAVDKKYTRSIDNWILGRQRDEREVEATLKAIPQAKKPAPEEIMTLAKGHFIACLHDDVWRVYVQPLWLPEQQAIAIALEKLDVEMVARPEVKVDEEMVWKQKYEETISLLDKAQGENDNLSRAIGQLKLDLDSEKRGMDELKAKAATVEQLIGSLRTLLDVDLDKPKGQRNVNLGDEQLTVSMTDRQRVENIDTSKFLGKVLATLVKKGTQSAEQLRGAFLERGWEVGTDKTFGMNLLNAVKSGLVVKEGKTSNATYRLPREIKFEEAREG